MERYFNTTGSCNPKRHYMVNIEGRLAQIKRLIDRGEYFTINRARQYGKTTTIQALTEYLREDYIVVSLDFQKMSHAEFADETTFSTALVSYLWKVARNKQNPAHGLDSETLEKMKQCADSNAIHSLGKLFELLSELCGQSDRPIVMIIDEVDSATNNQVFLDFLAQLRGYYLDRDHTPTFQSVILAGVYDVKNIKRKLRPDEAHKVNSPWNIAADFKVDMSFAQPEIAKMLEDYENDHHTGMDIALISSLISDYTSGYPFLVSRLCKLIDEDIAGSVGYPDEAAAWTKSGFLEAVKLLVHEKNTLFDSLTGKLIDYPELKTILSYILFDGRSVSFVATNPSVEIAAMFGFVRDAQGRVAISNRIFETVLYNHLLLEEELESDIYASAEKDKNQFVEDGRLNMKLVLERFVVAFNDLYGDQDERFVEEVGRKYFMLFLKPIINGTGNSYVEARTRNMKRTDIVVDYCGEQFVVELKIWRGGKYHEDGERQIAEYLDFYHLKTGYLLTFSFNQNKEIGVKEIQYGDCTLIEAVV